MVRIKVPTTRSGRDRGMASISGRALSIMIGVLSQQTDTVTISIARCLQIAGGYEVHVITPERTSPLSHSRFVTFHSHSLDSATDVVDALQLIDPDGRRPVVIPVTEKLIELVGQARRQLAPIADVAPMPTPQQCRQADDKWACHLAMKEAGIAVPDTILADADLLDLLEHASHWAHGGLIKPRHGHGGIGIVRWESQIELSSALADREGRLGEYIVQEYVPGDDIGCNLLAVDGRVTTSVAQRGRLRIPGHYSAPMGLDLSVDADADLVAVDFARATGWNGVANIDMRRRASDQKLLAVEVNPRYWQNLLGSLTAGINFPDLHCQHAIGRYPERATPTSVSWTNFYAITDNIAAVRVGLTQWRSTLRGIDFGVIARDPHVEARLFAKRSVNVGRNLLDRLRKWLDAPRLPCPPRDQRAVPQGLPRLRRPERPVRSRPRLHPSVELASPIDTSGLAGRTAAAAPDRLPHLRKGDLTTRSDAIVSLRVHIRENSTPRHHPFAEN